jgi:hypothetical protein
MNNLTLQQQLKEINQSTIHNIRFLLESYSEEVLEAIDEHVLALERKNKEPLEEIKKEVKSVIRTLKGIETVITHHKEING